MNYLKGRILIGYLLTGFVRPVSGILCRARHTGFRVQSKINTCQFDLTGAGYRACLSNLKEPLMVRLNTVVSFFLASTNRRRLLPETLRSMWCSLRMAPRSPKSSSGNAATKTTCNTVTLNVALILNPAWIAPNPKTRRPPSGGLATTTGNFNT